MRTFAYVRVSTTAQEIEAAAFKVDPRRVVFETVSSGSVIAQHHR